jgi:hypothetical protein
MMLVVVLNCGIPFFERLSIANVRRSGAMDVLSGSGWWAL